MKIAVFHNLPSGGAKRAVYGFVKNLVRKGHQTDVFVPSTADETFLSLREFSTQFHVLPVTRTIKGVVQSAIKYVIPARFSAVDLEKTEKGLADLINAGNYDVAFVEQDDFTVSPFILKFLQKPSLYYCQQPSRLTEAIRTTIWSRPGNGKQRLRRQWQDYLAKKLPRIEKEIVSFARYIVTNSFFSRETILQAYGVNSYVCYLGVDTQMFRPLQLSRGDYVLCVGSFIPVKGYDFLVKAIARIKSESRPKLLVVCNAVEENYLQYVVQLAQRRRVAMEVIRNISDEELVRFYYGARLLVYAPYLEPFGLAVLEAMACATPVVAVREGGIRESVLHSETGLLVDRDEGVFAEAVSTLLSDETGRIRMGKKATEVIREFWTWDHATERLIRHLQRAIVSFHEK